jgi:hypothetical protein
MILLLLALLSGPSEAHARRIPQLPKPGPVFWKTKYGRCYQTDLAHGCRQAASSTFTMLGMGRCACPMRVYYVWEEGEIRYEHRYAR